MAHPGQVVTMFSGRDLAPAVNLNNVGSLDLTSGFVGRLPFPERVQYVHTCSYYFRRLTHTAPCGWLNQKQINTVGAGATDFAQLSPSLPPSLLTHFSPSPSLPPSFRFFRSLPTLSCALAH